MKITFRHLAAQLFHGQVCVATSLLNLQQSDVISRSRTHGQVCHLHLECNIKSLI